MTADLKNTLSEGRKLILLHSNADADAVGCGIAISLFFGDSILYAPVGVSRVGKKLLSATDTTVEETAEQGDFENIVIVDASSKNMLGIDDIDWQKSIVIDHHAKTEECEARIQLIDEDAVTCCEIIWEQIGRPETIDRKIGLALLTGIYADSGSFHYAKPRTLFAAAEVMKASGIKMDEVLDLFGTTQGEDISQRISRLKGAQRLRFERNGEWIVAVTQVGAFEASVCRGLIGVGADVALCASQDDDNYRLTARANPKARDAGLHLGKLMRDMSNEVGYEGGGHDCAAGMSGTGDAEAILNICAEKIMQVLKKAD